MKCMLIERLEWWTSKTMPNIEEYLYVTSITFGSRLIPLTTQYYLGINISKDLLESDEIYGLCNCTGIVMRLLNDLQTYKVTSLVLLFLFLAHQDNLHVMLDKYHYMITYKKKLSLGYI